MLGSSCKDTLKIIFRSRTFYVMLILLILFAVFKGVSVHYTTFDPELNESIADTDPRFIITYNKYIDQTMNTVYSDMMLFAMPLFTIILTSTIVKYIKNSGEDSKSALHFMGRIVALTVLNFTVVLLTVFISFYVYIFSRGGVHNIGTSIIVVDSAIRLLRNIVFLALPCILMYMGLTFAVGTICKKSIFGTVVSIGYIVFYFSLLMLNSYFPTRVLQFFTDYLSPLPNKLVYFLIRYDTKSFENTITHLGTNAFQAVLCICVLLIGAFLYFTASYICIRKHKRQQ